MTPRRSRDSRERIAFGLLSLWVGGLFGCVGPDLGAKPAWIEGSSEQFSPNQYLLGLGEADSQPQATERAYAAVARIFKAEISSHAQDWESYRILEKHGRAQHERRLTIDRVIRVSTDKALENVRVLDRWVDPQSGIHYTLAAMHRGQAEAALLERIAELDRKVATELDTAGRPGNPLATIKNLKRALHHLLLRDAHNADLRVIRLSGQGEPPVHHASDVSTQLEEYLAGNVQIGVAVVGDEAEAVRRAMMEGMIREGLPVTDRPVTPEGFVHASELEAPLTLIIKGSVRIWKAGVPDPVFSYARWCGDFVIVDVATQRVVGAVSKRGREGHLTDQEALTRAARAMQEALTSDLAKSIADHVYGHTDQDQETAVAPAACQRDG